MALQPVEDSLDEPFRAGVMNVMPGVFNFQLFSSRDARGELGEDRRRREGIMLTRDQQRRTSDRIRFRQAQVAAASR